MCESKQNKAFLGGGGQDSSVGKGPWPHKPGDLSFLTRAQMVKGDSYYLQVVLTCIPCLECVHPHKKFILKFILRGKERKEGREEEGD